MSWSTLGAPAPVALVGHTADVLAVHPLHDLEGAGAHDRRLVGEVVGRVVAVEAAPDVLRQDRHPHREDVGLGPRAGDHDGRVVGGGRRLDALQRREEGLQLVLEHEVVGEGDVVRRERHAVLPLDAAADRERPGQTVGRMSPARREPRLSLEVRRGVVGEEVVFEVKELE